MPYSDELDVIIKGLDSTIEGLDYGTPEEIEIARGLREQAERLKGLPEEKLSELVEWAHARVAEFTEA